VFWELVGAQRGPVVGQEELAASGKEAWWQATQLEWGTPGKAMYVDDRAIGYATFAPAEHFPRVRRMGQGVSSDALLLAVLWVHPDHRGTGAAKTLLQSVLRETHRRGCRALEAYGARLPASNGGFSTCLIPEDFLLANGFELLHNDGDYPLLRLDLRKTVRWQESVSHALEGVVSVLSRRERQRVPARPAMEARR
jgi:GNAT superfamily N-acetyltransferase